jgi:hypothetical protein
LSALGGNGTAKVTVVIDPPVAVGDGTVIYCCVYLDRRLFKGHFEATAKRNVVPGFKLSISIVNLRQFLYIPIH